MAFVFINFSNALVKEAQGSVTGGDTRVANGGTLTERDALATTTKKHAHTYVKYTSMVYPKIL